MLISQSIFRALCSLKHTDIQLYYNAISRIDTSNCIKCSSYSHYLVSFEKGKVTTNLITVYRVIRKGDMSRHTHAILPDIIVPYSSYSIRFIIYILYLYTHRTCSATEFCSKFHISRSTIYDWMNLYSNHLDEWISLLKTADKSLLDNELKSISDFLYQFMHTTGHPFLMKCIGYNLIVIPP